MVKPLTILLSCHNHALYLDDMFRSIYHSRFQQFDLIISDDASTDGSQNVIAAWNQVFPDMKVFLHKENQGGNGRGNIRFLFNQPIGTPYTCLLDTDDSIYPDKLERQLYLLSQGHRAVHSEITMCDEFGTITHRYWWRMVNQFIPDLMTFDFEVLNNRVFIATLMAETELYKKVFDFDLFDKLGIFLGDYAMTLRMCTMIEKSGHGGIKYDPTPLSFYRNRPNSESHRDEALTISDTIRLQQLARNGDLTTDL